MYLPFVILILIDQITKTLFANRDFFVFGLHLHPTRNYGLPFGIDFGAQVNFFVLFFAYAIVAWLVMKTPLEGKRAYWGKSLFLAGAASNLADRIIYGYVRDFIDASLGFVFNFADVFIAVGLIILLLSGVPKKTIVEKV
jgi:signal peptidase II